MSSPSVARNATEKPQIFRALPEIWRLVRPRRGLLVLGLGLMAVNRISGLVLPASTKFLVDDVIGKRHLSVLYPLVGAVLAATLIQGNHWEDDAERFCHLLTAGCRGSDGDQSRTVGPSLISSFPGTVLRDPVGRPCGAKDGQRCRESAVLGASQRYSPFASLYPASCANREPDLAFCQHFRCPLFSR